MLQIISHFELISIPVENTELAIYKTDYYIDESGVRFDEWPHPKVHEYGDITLETISTKYIFRRVYAAYQFCSEIIESIQKQKDQPIITINLDEDLGFQGFQAEDGLEIIPKNCLYHIKETLL